MPISWTRKKQAAVSHSTTEAEIVSLDAWLRMEGTPALKLWDTITDIVHPQAGGDFKAVYQPDPLGDIASCMSYTSC